MATMRAVRIDAFGSPEEALKIVLDQPRPEAKAGELLIRIEATSVNPIDCAVRSGYGSEYFQSRGLIAMPLIPGRDVAGVIDQVGEGVAGFAVGERVYAGTVNSATAEFISVPAADVAPMPRTLTFEQAAALPYAALTAWTALTGFVGLTRENTATRRVIVPRGAGGVGSFAIQWLKAWGAHVATIVSTRNIKLVRSLGANEVVDYTREDFRELLHDYDVAFDTAFDTEQGLLDALKIHADAAYVSIVTPKLTLVDQWGLDEGLRRGDEFLANRKAEQAALGRRYDWSFMKPNGQALREIAAMVDAGQVRPVIDRTYPMERIAEAHRFCETKQAQGKIIVTIGPEAGGPTEASVRPA